MIQFMLGEVVLVIFGRNEGWGWEGDNGILETLKPDCIFVLLTCAGEAAERSAISEHSLGLRIHLEM